MTEPTLQDIIWVLLCAALVFLMQAGFLCLEHGFVRSKNSINVAVKNLLDFCVVGLIFSLFGYGLMFGTSQMGLFGTSSYFLSDLNTPWSLTFFLFQLVFCCTAVTIISGAVAERLHLLGYLAIAVLTAVIIYPIFGHWVWAGANQDEAVGWLAKMGFVDFAGASVVHSTGAWIALAILLLVGSRLGRFDKKVAIQGHSIPTSALGLLLLWLGWFGFNGGSLLRATEQIPGILVNTFLAGMVGGCIALLLTWTHDRLINPRHVINGILAGLVSITAGCHAIEPGIAILVGAIGAIICYLGTHLLESLRIDDAVDAIPVHGCAGIWGTLSVGLFADLESLGTGLNRTEQIFAQLTGIGVCFVWSFTIAFVVFFLLQLKIPLRITPEIERVGLNISEHGASTEVFDLLTDMQRQQLADDYSKPVSVDPHTEVGQIAKQYNKILERVIDENAKANHIARSEREARNAAQEATQMLEERVDQLNEFNRLSVGRELRMVELKQEVNDLARVVDDKARYDLTSMQNNKIETN